MAIKIPRVQTDDRLINQLQQNFVNVLEPIFFQTSGQFVAGLTGTTLPQNGTVYWQRSTATGPITMLIPTLTGTSNTTAATLTGLPKGLWPTSEQALIVRTVDSGVFAIAFLTISTLGAITLYKTADSATFTNTGIKGVAETSVTYMQ